MIDNGVEVHVHNLSSHKYFNDLNYLDLNEPGCEPGHGQPEQHAFVLPVNELQLGPELDIEQQQQVGPAAELGPSLPHWPMGWLAG